MAVKLHDILCHSTEGLRYISNVFGGSVMGEIPQDTKAHTFNIYKYLTTYKHREMHIYACIN